MLYHSNYKYTLNVCRATYRQAVKGSCTTILITVDHTIQVAQDSRRLLTQQGEDRKGALPVLQVNTP